MSTNNIETRLAALEAEVAELRKSQHKENAAWWEAWIGAFKDDPYFKKAMTLGKKWRDAQRPKPSKQRK
jgi:hypothetical protein